MKNIKIITFTVILFLTHLSALAQRKAGDWRLGYGFNGGIALSDAFDYSLGIDGRLQYDASLKTSLLVTTGYTHLFDNVVKGLGIVPIKLGFKSYFGDQLYVLGEVGSAIGTKTGMGTSFLWSPGIGVATKHIDVSLRYENYNKLDSGQIALRLAYGYKL
jgi:hypothetical protein